MRKIFKPLIPQYQSVQIGARIYDTCIPSKEEFDNFWFKKAGLPPTFQSWFSVSQIYVWMCLVRLRKESVEISKDTKQQLIDSFFTDAERRIRNQGIKSGKIVNDSLKDLNSGFLGTVSSFDQGFVSDDTVLAAAIWRNLLSNCESTHILRIVVEFVRQQLSLLDKVPSDAFIRGNFSFDKSLLL
ncbi:hypothetical protein BB560_003405 [Smittium megazygosporum]|uniref:Ubiquinol-cytochrome c chaperone domain-containing protein n=1 Tax=Smittium megazygosporum TaxID=133381 RepID=A0A2T9ZC77_9FUNG|nr:hypothetical protein BB560_003405 [Smittium megazygosporum]